MMTPNKPAPKYCDITGFEVLPYLLRLNIKIVSVGSTFMIKMLVCTLKCLANQ